MFKSFDEFLKHESWASLNWPDMDRFYQALNVATRVRGFTPQGLGDFLDKRHQQQFGGASLKTDIRKSLENRAETVQQFLHAIEQQASPTAVSQGTNR